MYAHSKNAISIMFNDIINKYFISLECHIVTIVIYTVIKQISSLSVKILSLSGWQF